MAVGRKRLSKKQRLEIKAIRAKRYSPAYEKRLIRSVKKGKTRQQARGHKAKEHVERKAREKQKRGGLTSREESVIIRWHGETFNPKGYREVPSEDDLLDWSREKGYDAFKLYRKTWDDKRREYLAQLKEGSWESLGMGEIYRLTEQAKADDYRWLYYH